MNEVNAQVLRKLIRDHTGCGMLEAKAILEKVAKDMGIMTRRDRFIAAVLEGIQSIGDTIENRLLSAEWAVDIADRAMQKADGELVKKNPLNSRT